MLSSSCRFAAACAAVVLVLSIGTGTAARPPKSDDAGGSRSWPERVDQLWSDGKPPSGMCSAYVVRAMPPLLRGSTSGRGCLVRAVVAAEKGDRKLAVGWLKAGLCGNGDRPRSGADEALDYAVRRYGDRVR